MKPETCRPIHIGTLLRKYRRYKELYQRPLSSDLQWGRPYSQMMGELMGEL
jgi:hypothetical protein